MGAERTANDDRIQSEGRKDNAAQHLNAAEPNAGAERYPPVSKDDGVEAPATERRSFEGVRILPALGVNDQRARDRIVIDASPTDAHRTGRTHFGRLEDRL